MKKRTTNKLFALLITLVMVLGMLPMTATAANGDLYVGGVLMQNGMYLPSSPNGSTKALQNTAPSTGGYAYLSADGTLTLHDYQFKTTSGETNSVYSEQANGLDILLEGNTKLENKDNCIEAKYGNVTIRGNSADGADTLTMTSGIARYTVYAADTSSYSVGNISIENCKIKGTGGDDCMFAQRGFNINNCELDLLGSDNALCAVFGGIVIKNSTGKLYGQSSGAYSNLGNITIENSNLDIRSNGSYSGSIALKATYGSVTFKDSLVIVESSAAQAIKLNSGSVPTLTYTNGVKVSAGDDSDSAVSVAQADLSGNWYTNKFVKIEPKTATPTTDPTPVESSIALLKEIKGKNIPSTFSFTFKLKASDGSVFDTLTVTADKFTGSSGIFSFSKPVSFTAEGTYDFTVTEVNDGEFGWTYDPSVMTVRYTVIEGNEGLEISDFSVYEGGVEADLIFTNTYDGSGSGGGETPVDVNYKVEHWLQQANGTYALEETENLTGTVGQIVNAVSKTYEGYTLDEDNDEAVTSLELTAIATTVPTLKLYYNLNESTTEPDISATVVKAETSTPKNGEFYVEGEKITYSITVTNTGDVSFDGGYDVYDILAPGTNWIDGGEHIDCEADCGEDETNVRVFTFEYTVTAADAAAGSVSNYAWLTYNVYENGDLTDSGAARSNTVVSKTGVETIVDPGTDPGEDEDEKYDITVINGKATIGAGTIVTESEAGVTITITADTPASGKVFDKWIIKSDTQPVLANANGATTTFTMPEGAVTVEATYKDAPATPEDDNPETGGDRPVDPNVPQTGDSSHTALWIALAGMSLLGMIAVLFAKKRSYSRHSR